MKNLKSHNSIKFLILMIIIISQDLLYSSDDCNGPYQKFANRSSAPRELSNIYKISRLYETYEFDVCTLNPWYIVGDFDADGRYDYAVVLKSKNGGREKRIVVLWNNGDFTWLDRDDQLKYPGPEAWHIYPRYKSVGKGMGGGVPPGLVGDGILMIKLEASSSLVYWNGNRFVYYWQGD